MHPCLIQPVTSGDSGDEHNALWRSPHQLIGQIQVPIKLGNLESQSEHILTLDEETESFPFISSLDFLEFYSLSLIRLRSRMKHWQG